MSNDVGGRAVSTPATSTLTFQSEPQAMLSMPAPFSVEPQSNREAWVTSRSDK